METGNLAVDGVLASESILVLRRTICELQTPNHASAKLSRRLSNHHSRIHHGYYFRQGTSKSWSLLNNGTKHSISVIFDDHWDRLLAVRHWWAPCPTCEELSHLEWYYLLDGQSSSIC
jgi:hypothetical protein